MRVDFKDMGERRTFINHFITRNTNLEKKCQFCGEKAEIQHGSFLDDPYKIQLICRTCKREHGLLKKDSRGLSKEIPIIDLRDYITSNRIKYGEMTDELVLKFNNIINSNMTKTKAIDYIGVTALIFNRLVNELPDTTREKLLKKLKENRGLKIKSTFLNVNCTESSNNINKLKKEKCISGRDIEAKVGVTACSVCNIALNKVDATIKTKCLIAEALEESVYTVFPNMPLLDKIYTYNDYLKLNKKYKTKIYNKYKSLVKTKQKHVVANLSSLFNISVGRIYEIIADRDNDKIILSYQELEKIHQAVKNFK